MNGDCGMRGEMYSPRSDSKVVFCRLGHIARAFLGGGAFMPMQRKEFRYFACLEIHTFICLGLICNV